MSTLFALTIIGFIILILLATGQLSYKKSPRLTYVLWGLAALVIVYFIYNLNTKNERRGNLNNQRYVGAYKIDLENSFYDSIDLSNYNGLLLFVKDNNSFEFSQQSPFFQSRTGRWQLMDDGDIMWTEISIDETRPQRADVRPDKWVFNGRHLLVNGNKRNSIVFVR